MELAKLAKLGEFVRPKKNSIFADFSDFSITELDHKTTITELDHKTMTYIFSSCYDENPRQAKR